MVRITDNLDITIVVDWDLNRIKQKSIGFFFIEFSSWGYVSLVCYLRITQDFLTLE